MRETGREGERDLQEMMAARMARLAPRNLTRDPLTRNLCRRDDATGSSMGK